MILRGVNPSETVVWTDRLFVLHGRRTDPAVTRSGATECALDHIRRMRTRIDLLIGLGQALYLGEIYGPAAELFGTALDRAAMLPPRDRALLLDWWATALDREAQTRPYDHRPPVYQRISERMDQELRDDPANSVASYWQVVGARGASDLDRAWSAAIAAWVRSTLNPMTMAQLRGDLDQVMEQALIPERARSTPPREGVDAVEMLRAEWSLVKENWK